MRILPCFALLYLLSGPLANAAEFDFTFGAGFSDTTAMEPVGGNPATTLGEARQKVLIEAGRIWGTLLVSNVRIGVMAEFVDTQACSETTGTLAAAGPTNLFRNFTGSMPNTFYVAALANAIAGRDLNPNTIDPVTLTTDPRTLDIVVRINKKVGTAGCLGARPFYYGFNHDNSRGIDLLTVVLHEFAHGLGFLSEIDLAPANPADTPGATADSSGATTGFVQQVFDEQLGRAWPMLSPAERVESATRTGFLAWNGSKANAQRARLANAGITNQSRLKLNAPAMLDAGSSVSHWSTDFSAPDLLMEPRLSTTLTSIVDVTVCALQDIGWQVTRCADGLANRVPVATPQTVSTAQGTAVTITLQATDGDNDPLTFLTQTNPTSGTLTGGGTQVVRYQPNAGFSGADSFTFQASDGASTSAPATVMINVAAAAPAPPPPTAAPTPGGRRGGGGAMSEWLLAALALLAVARAYQLRQRARVIATRR